MSAIVETARLAKRYTGVDAVMGIDLQVPEGAVFALAGPNGAGKTTALKMLMNIISPTAGAATVLGVDSRRLGPPEFARIGYMSENQQLPDWMRVGYFLDYCKPFYPQWDDAEASALVRQFDLPLDRRLRALSRGMRVKAALASSLAYRPKLLVLDEPFSGLDVLVREQLIEGVLERVGEMTVLLASHDLAEIESFASHIAYIEQGRLRFVEEMNALSQRFREVEVTLEAPVPAKPAEWPPEWLIPEVTGVVARFVDSRYREDHLESNVRRLFTGVRSVAARSMPLRSIFVALAKSAR